MRSSDSENRPMLRVQPIENGTVIDHITPGQALNVLKILRLPDSSEGVVSVVMKAPSIHGKKDVVKIEGREINVNEVSKISLIAPNAVINIIRDFEVSQKKKVHIPEYVEGVVKCINPNCISNSREPITSKFTVREDNERIILRCNYCERVISEEIAEHLL